MIDLYQKSLGKGKTEGSGYEAHFNFQPEKKDEVGCSQQVPMEPNSNGPPLTTYDYTNTENMIIQFASNDMFGDLN